MHNDDVPVGVEMKIERSHLCSDFKCKLIWTNYNRQDFDDGVSHLCYGQMAKTHKFLEKQTEHINDISKCEFTPLKGMLRFFTNIDDLNIDIRAILAVFNRLVKAEDCPKCKKPLYHRTMRGIMDKCTGEDHLAGLKHLGCYMVDHVMAGAISRQIPDKDPRPIAEEPINSKEAGTLECRRCKVKHQVKDLTKCEACHYLFCRECWGGDDCCVNCFTDLGRQKHKCFKCQKELFSMADVKRCQKCGCWHCHECWGFGSDEKCISCSSVGEKSNE